MFCEMDSVEGNSLGGTLNDSSESSSEMCSKRHSGQILSTATGDVDAAQAHPTSLVAPVGGSKLVNQDNGRIGGFDKFVGNNCGLRVPFVNLFKNNRLAKDDYKLEYMENGIEKLNFGYKHIDSIEKTYGICLLGFVLNGHPPTTALRDLVKKWGTNVQFQTHEHGWITFTFLSIELKNKVLTGGNYKVFGHHLFLKEMPRCFRFREEDLTSFPSWVQVHGLPPDCWSFHILSNIISRIGRPVHVDMLTFDRNKKTKYARVIVEIDTSIQRKDGMTIGLPIGDVDIKFVYEIDVNKCSYCKEIGHPTRKCTRQPPTEDVAGGTEGMECNKQSQRSRSNNQRPTSVSRSRSQSRVNLDKKAT